jgi:hypothetical protein
MTLRAVLALCSEIGGGTWASVTAGPSWGRVAVPCSWTTRRCKSPPT